MTNKVRNAIVDYWIWRRWADMDKATFRRFLRRISLRVLVLLCVVSGSYGVLPSHAATETKGLLTAKPKLLSKEQKAQDKVSKVAKVAKAVKVDLKAKIKEAHPDAKFVDKFTTGTLAYQGKNKISVEFNSGEEGAEEILFTVDPELKLKGVKKLSDIKRGDKVEVKYRQAYLEPKKKGEETVVLEMAVVEINFLQKAEDLAAALQAATALPADPPVAPKAAKS